MGETIERGGPASGQLVGKWIFGRGCSYRQHLSGVGEGTSDFCDGHRVSGSTLSAGDSGMPQRQQRGAADDIL